MRDLDSNVESIRNKISQLFDKRKETTEGGKVSGSQLTFRDFLKEKVEALKALRD